MACFDTYPTKTWQLADVDPNRGEYTWGGTSGSYTFVVPASVTSISMVGIGGGAGSESESAFSGSGGSLRYKNNLAVTPGESLQITFNTPGGWSNPGATVTVQRGATVLLRAVAGLPGSNNIHGQNIGDGGGNGGPGVLGGSCGAKYGGDAGRYLGNGGVGGSGGLNGSGTTLYGEPGSGAALGAGRGTQSGSSCGGSGSSGGGSGAGLRIIWPGTTRQFPYLAQ